GAGPGRGGQARVVGAVTDGDGLGERDALQGGEAGQCGRLAGPVENWPDQLTGQPAVGDLQRVGGCVVDTELGGQRVGDLAEPTADDGAAVVQTLEGADQRARTGGQLDGVAHLVDGRGRQTREQADPGTQRLGEVELAAHRPGGDLGDFVEHSGSFGEHLDRKSVV